MKTFFRWGLIVGGILVFVGIFYKIFFYVWPFYPMWGWRYHSFGPRMWPVFPFFGMLILIVTGILIAGYFFKALRSSSASKKDESAFCPYCGQETKRDKSIPEVHAEKL
ncbi:MAG: hypothetical protein ACUVQ9_11455 [Thermodesulfobacteriota bacterium]